MGVTSHVGSNPTLATKMGADMRVIIAGSRGVTDYEIVKQAVESSGFRVTEVVSGTARGVDQLGEKWAAENDIPVVKFPARWELHGRAAGMIRNEDMAKYASALIAVWDGESRGTKHMIWCAQLLGRQVHVVEYNPSVVKRETR